MDELAYELALDPLELRLRNYAELDPTAGKPFSAKRLRESVTPMARGALDGPIGRRDRARCARAESLSGGGWPRH